MLAKTRQRRLSIIGDAGSGKSALLQWAGLTLARKWMRQGKLSKDQQAFIRALCPYPWSPLPTPILIPLRDFGAYCRDTLKRAPDAPALTEFIHTLGQRRYRDTSLPTDFFARLLQGRCLLMFDGIDEVNQAERDAVRAAVDACARAPQSQRHLFIVTSRPSTAHIADTLTDFRRADVQALTPQQRGQLIGLWCEAVYKTPTEKREQTDELSRRIEDEPVRELAETPLMVNIFALVYYHERKLPNQRAELYDLAVKDLLSDQHRERRAADEEWGGYNEQSRLEHLSLIAFILHDEGLSDVHASELLAREMLWKQFGKDQEAAQHAALDFLERAALRGGLLRQDGNRFDFYIRRFREFLAARWLAKKLEGQWSEVFRRHVEDDLWEEPLLLGAGFLAYDDPDKAQAYMRQLTDAQTWRTPTQENYGLALAGVALSDLLGSADKKAMEAFAPMKASLPPRMKTVFEHKSERNTPIIRLPLRRRLGLALGALGDPRFTPTLAAAASFAVQSAVHDVGLQIPREQKIILPTFITIPAGDFRMGTSDDEAELLKAQDAEPWKDERPQHTVYVSEFAIGKYPVTNAEFRCFVTDAKGYDHEKFWGDEGWRWRTDQLKEADLSYISDKDIREAYVHWLKGRPKAKRHQPFFWDDPQWNAPNLPVVGVTWYEAEAYCNWLSEVTGQPIRLPTEAEWEKAARYKDLAGLGDPRGLHMLWPWGDTWDKDKCNSSESGFNSTTPVGLYPNGASPLGVADMVGNVWEWCLDGYNADLYKQREAAGQEVHDPKEPLTNALRALRVLRGGSWLNRHRLCRSAWRYRFDATYFNNIVGLRVVRSPIRF
jgi:formylglycine-generating enzyme required for sulfatase activity